MECLKSFEHLKDIDLKGNPKKRAFIVPFIVLILVSIVFIVDIAPVYNNEKLGILADDLLIVFQAQGETALHLVLYALIPGLFGLYYRKAFSRWFFGGFALLFVANAISFFAFQESLSAEILKGLENPYALPGHPYLWYLGAELLLLGVLLGIRLRLGGMGEVGDEGTEKHTPKNIVVCIDGTWNHPGQRDYGYLAQTNVFKLWASLKGKLTNKYQPNANLCKRYGEKQVGFYYHGVGNAIENSAIGMAFGGAFGFGAEAIKQRAYLDIIHEYHPGDRIFIFGFSRGAAIARLLASYVAKQGIPKRLLTLRWLGRKWPVWMSDNKNEDINIEVLGCWETVASFGLPVSFLGIPFQKINLFKNFTVPLAVKRAYHIVALDETRDAFEPTLMNPDPVNPNRIVQVWLSGNHANIGGGYKTDGLSDVALDFLLSCVSSGHSKTLKKVGDESWGIYLRALTIKTAHSSSDGSPDTLILKPNYDGKIRFEQGAIYKYGPRKMPIDALVHDAVFDRMQSPQAEYAPASLFRLNQELYKKSVQVSGEVELLHRTKSITINQKKTIEKWIKQSSTLSRWSKAAPEICSSLKQELVNK
ncbi:MAG: DUF2235 domain-containing protein [Gammaproteobacteria bacterium]|nr:DUF2235 domain-containing protein [Gammaproteobacteria bacterium]